MSPKSIASPKLEKVTYSILFTLDGFLPLIQTPRVELATDALSILMPDRSPNTTAFPAVTRLKVSIDLISCAGDCPPNNTVLTELLAAEDELLIAESSAISTESPFDAIVICLISLVATLGSFPPQIYPRIGDAVAAVFVRDAVSPKSTAFPKVAI